MGPLGHVTILLWIGLSSLLLLSPTVRATVSCTDQEIPADCNTTIVCNFTQDIYAGRLEFAINWFPINTTTDDISSRKQVLSCNWVTGDSEPQCVLGPGFTSKYIDGSIAAVRVDSATKEFEGIYRCQLINQNVQITNCKLNVKPPGKCEHENSLVPTNPTNPSRASSPQETESTHWRAIAIAFIVLFVIAIAFPLAVFFGHCKHGELGQLPKRLRALISVGDNQRNEADNRRSEEQRLIDRTTNLEEQIRTLTEEKQTLTRQKETLEGEKQTLTKQKEMIEGEKEALRAELQRFKGEREKLNREKQMLEQDKQKLSTELNNRLTNTNKGLTTHVEVMEQLTGHNTWLSKEIGRLTADNNKFQKETERLTEENERLTKETKNVKAEKDELKTQIKNLTRQIKGRGSQTTGSYQN